MKITIIAAGKIKERWLSEGIDEYRKRLGAYCDLNIIEVQDASDSLPEEKAKAEESERLLAQVPPKSILVALDLHGKQMDSLVFSDSVMKWLEQGGAQLSFIIAGSLGFSPALLAKCHHRLCMGLMTYPHQMVRLFLVEQLYRAFKIARHERYHK